MIRKDRRRVSVGCHCGHTFTILLTNYVKRLTEAVTYELSREDYPVVRNQHGQEFRKPDPKVTPNCHICGRATHLLEPGEVAAMIAADKERQERLDGQA